VLWLFACNKKFKFSLMACYKKAVGCCFRLRCAIYPNTLLNHGLSPIACERIAKHKKEEGVLGINLWHAIIHPYRQWVSNTKRFFFSLHPASKFYILRFGVGLFRLCLNFNVHKRVCSYFVKDLKSLSCRSYTWQIVWLQVVTLLGVKTAGA
jgi:hypothetical protein